MVFYGVLAVILLVLCFLTTRERVTPPAAQKSDLGRDMKTYSPAYRGLCW